MGNCHCSHGSPSGALADVMGRRNLLITAGALMVAEMILICFAPRGNPGLLFSFFLMNRILSGSAEAAASGADEALAYDTLKSYGREKEWGQVLERQMRYRSIGSMIAVTIGALVYDPSMFRALFTFLGWNITISQSITLRLPLFLTLIMAIFALISTLRMKEVKFQEGYECEPKEACSKSIISAFRVTFQAGYWIRKTPFALIIIGAGLVFDNVIRILLTFTSQYYRVIQLPEAAFGIIGASMSAMGIIMPRVARWLVETHTPRFNMLLLAGITCIGLTGMSFLIPYFGLFPMISLVAVMQMVFFFSSHYLNQITSSNQRATVLSFKGLSYNLAYGISGWLYALLLAYLRPGVMALHPELTSTTLENRIFMASMSWFPWFFLILFITLILFAKWQLKGRDEHKMIQ